MNRSRQIDVLRAVAVFLVLGRHLGPGPDDMSAALHPLSVLWFQGGWVGVDLFFVLSGFLVSGLLFREYERHRRLRIGHFLVRRGLKIYPPFWLLIAATVAFGVLERDHLQRRALASELLFIQNYGPAMWNHTWSLAVEEHFYLLLALGLFVLSRRKTDRPFSVLPGAFAAVALTCLALRLWTGAVVPAYDYRTHVAPTHLRLDSLLFGVLLSYLYHRDPVAFLAIAARWRRWLLLGGVLLLAPAFAWPQETTPFVSSFGLTLFYLGSGCLLVSALGCRAPAGRFGRGLAYVGSHSYSMYLWHMPMRLWGTRVAAKILGSYYTWYAMALVFLVGSVLLGIVMSIATEIPVLRARDRFFPSRGSPLATGAGGEGGLTADFRGPRDANEGVMSVVT